MSDELIVIDDNNIEQFISETDCPFILEFWAKWCPSCVTMGEVLKSLSHDYSDKIKFCSVDVETSPDLSENIEYTPTLIFFSDGKIVGLIEGAVTEEIVKTAIETVLSGKEFELET